MSGPTKEEADWAFAAYEAVRHRLPQPVFSGDYERVDTLSDIAEGFDTFLLDSFGVLNIGETAIPGAIERVNELRSKGKRVLIVTNAAGYPKHVQLARYRKLGFDFKSDDIVSSRETVLAAITNNLNYNWGVMSDTSFGRDEIEHLNMQFLEDDPVPYSEADAFLMLGAGIWTGVQQDILERALIDKPRPVYVGNPDIVAPREDGLSREPGYFAHLLSDRTGVNPKFFGKPFTTIFDHAFERLSHDIDLSRTLMVGDTLHTDILGGAAAGVKTALISEYGALAETDVELAIRSSGITPDFIVKRP